MRFAGPFRVGSVGVLGVAIVCAMLKTGATAPPAHKRLTFTHDIAPIVYSQCANCHHPGDVGPFSLLTYQDMQRRAQQIALVTAKRLMPPWKVQANGDFQGERHLTDEQTDLIKRWADEGAAEGDPSELPPVPHFPSEWTLGKPDMVVAPPAAYQLAAEGDDVYRRFVIPTHFAEDRYVSALDVRPGNRAVVHHVIAYFDTTGRARKLEGRDSQPGFTTSGTNTFLPSGMLGGWAPGTRPMILPAETGVLLPRGADIVMEVHYHKDGKPETDLSRVALYFNKQAVKRPFHIFPLMNLFINIPAGNRSYEARAGIPVPQDATLINIFPHMHRLGRQMMVTATFPDGTTRPLVQVSDWDFNWQGFYAYKQPIKLAHGTKINLIATYDNSTDNPYNPHSPPKDVHWGEQTTDEMCLCYLGYTYDAEQLPKSAAERERLSQAIQRETIGQR